MYQSALAYRLSNNCYVSYVEGSFCAVPTTFQLKDHLNPTGPPRSSLLDKSSSNITAYFPGIHLKDIPCKLGGIGGTALGSNDS